MGKTVLAFDLGASSGRAMLGAFDGGRITLTEVHRFENNPVSVQGTLYWDVLRLFYEIKQGIHKAALLGNIDCIGIDTWGVDFGLLDARGDLLQNPVHYRDGRTAGLVEEVAALLGEEDLYARTGIQVMELNTIFQLRALAKQRPELLANAKTALLMPDLLGYFLTGEKTAEYTIASTTQLMDPQSHSWDMRLFETLHLPALFPPIRPAGSPLGTLRDDLREELDIGAIPVVSVAGHDTASAVVAVPAREKDFLYISSGTWSLFGTELPSPVISDASRAYNIANEGGYGGNTRFLKNICGLWLAQETRRQYKREGENYSFGELERQAMEAAPFRCFIDPDDARFAKPGNLPRRIRAYCAETGQYVPETVGEIMRCINESLALKYRYTYEQIRECTKKEYAQIHIVGGGMQSALLCQMAASAMHKTLLAGPVEATALGNIAVQLLALGEIGDLSQARQIIGQSFPPIKYTPENADDWDAAYARFLQVNEVIS